MTRDQVKPEDLAREHAVLRVIALDLIAGIGMLVFSFLADSLTMIAESVRGILMFSIELVALVTLRRIHRRRFAEYDFGTGKIERVVNGVIASSLLIAAVWIALDATSRFDHEPSSSVVFYAMALLFIEYNVVVNVYGMISFLRANRDRPSIILGSQISARGARTTASAVVFLIALLAGIIPDPTVVNFLDVLGAAFVCVLMVRVGLQMLRESMPDLLDRALPDATQREIYRVLAENFASYDDVVAVRSRRSGDQLLVEAELGFRNDVTMAHVAKLQELLEEQLRAGLPNARLHVVPAVTRWAPGRDPRLSLRQVMGRTMARKFAGPADASD